MLTLILLLGIVSLTNATTSFAILGKDFKNNSTTSVNNSIVACDIEYTANVVHNKCYNDNSGSISLNVTGGTPGYTFQWSNGVSGNPISNLAAGNYSVTITDTQCCTKTGTIKVNNGPLIFVKAWIENADCYTGANGSIVLNVNGGAIPYTYLWSNGATTKDLINIRLAIIL
ncbi:hypothetical protein MASR1M65_14240 [Saprospiraceae bacterium]